MLTGNCYWRFDWTNPTRVIVSICLACLTGCNDNPQETPVTPPANSQVKAVVTNLTVDLVMVDRIFISWMAPPHKGAALRCDIRHSTDSLTLDNWFSVTQYGDFLPLADSGETQSYEITGATAGEKNYISIRLVDDYGNFGPVSTNAIAVPPSLLAKPIYLDFAGSDLTVSDFDRDGDVDIVATNPGMSGGNLLMLSNNGAGLFTQDQLLAINASLMNVRSGDLNHDGFPDLATSALGGLIFTLLNDGTGHFAITDSQAILLSPHGLQIGDLNGDGFGDVVAGCDLAGGKFGGSLGLLAVYFCNDSGKFKDMDTVNILISNTDVCLYDADEDGDSDLAAAYQNPCSVELYYNDGTGRNWEDHQTVIASDMLHPVAGDLNHDGRLDLIGSGVYGPTPPIIAALRNVEGGFTTKVSYPGAGIGSILHLGDFDGDGFLDAVRADYGFTLHINDGEGGFAGAARYAAGSGTYEASLAVADFDGDGHPDIATLQRYEGLFIFLSSL